MSALLQSVTNLGCFSAILHPFSCVVLDRDLYQSLVETVIGSVMAPSETD